MSQEPRKTSWWGTVPGMLTAAAGVITAVTGLLIALDQIGFFRADPEPVSATAAALEPAPGSAPSGVGVPAGSAQGAGAAGAIQAGNGAPALEAEIREVRVGEGRYQVLSVRTERRNADSYSLKFGIRLFNESPRYDIGFWDDSFRLLIDSIPRAPVSGLSTTAPSRAATDGEIEFVVPAAATGLVLEVSYQGEAATIPLRMASP